MEHTANNNDEIAIEFPPLIRVHKDGRVERLLGTETIPPKDDPQTGIQCKDVVFSPEKGLSARLFIPKVTNNNTNQTQKLPLIIYIHGGGFCVQSPFSPTYYGHLVSLVSKGNLMVVAIQYRLAPEHLLPVAYDDSWDAIKWVASHAGGNGPEDWLNESADLGSVFLVGDSSGANIAHTMGIRAGVEGFPLGFKIVGLVLVHPFFVDNNNQAPTKFIDYIYPTRQGWADPKINPVGAGPEHLARLGCSRVLVSVASEDMMVGKSGMNYYNALKKGGWAGEVDLSVSEGEGHIFHLRNPAGEKAQTLVDQIVSFIYRGWKASSAN